MLAEILIMDSAGDNVIYRKADIADCSHIATLYSIASDGVANYVWSTMALPGQKPEEVGMRRYQREDIVYSYLNCMIAEVELQVAGMMLAYPILFENDPDYTDCDPVLLPYARLEEDSSYYISGMALYPRYRGRGIGTRLLSHAEQRARELRFSKLSLIVFEKNTGALKLYQQSGYREVMREKIVPHPMIRCTGYALLLVKNLGEL